MATFDADTFDDVIFEFSEEGELSVHAAEYTCLCPPVDPSYPVVDGLEDDT